MSKSIICPNCGTVIGTEKGKFTTMRVSTNFIARLKDEQIDATFEDTLRRMLNWPEVDNPSIKRKK